MKKFLLFLLVFSAAAHIPLKAQTRVIEGKPGLFEKNLYISGNDTLPYRLLLPVNLQTDSAGPFPLIVFFHGAGERGTDNERQLTLCSKLFTDSVARIQYPCFVLAPQCARGHRWAEMDWGADSGKMTVDPSRYMKLTMSLIGEMRKWKIIDTTRIYVTGLSMGGYGTWDLACRKPEWIAAIAPVCGGGDEKQATKLINIPIWAFHGEKDKVVKPSRSVNMIRAVEKAGGKPKLTLYPGVEHNSWINAYTEKDFLSWMFAQHR